MAGLTPADVRVFTVPSQEPMGLDPESGKPPPGFHNSCPARDLSLARKLGRPTVQSASHALGKVHDHRPYCSEANSFELPRRDDDRIRAIATSRWSSREAQNQVCFCRFHLRNLILRVSEFSQLQLLRFRNEGRNLSTIVFRQRCISPPQSWPMRTSAEVVCLRRLLRWAELSAFL